MQIQKQVIPKTSISTSNADMIVARGMDLCRDLIGKVSFTEYFLLLLTGRKPDATLKQITDATLVAIAEHGMVPSVQAARMTYAAAPEALQGGVAAGLLGCGSVILGAAEEAGIILDSTLRLSLDEGCPKDEAARIVVAEKKRINAKLPGYGHPQHKAKDPRVDALFKAGSEAGINPQYVEIAEAIERVAPEIYGKELRLNVSAAIPAVLLGAGFPLGALKGIPILARTAGLIAHLHEELHSPSGFALSYQATQNAIYEGQAPESFDPNAS